MILDCIVDMIDVPYVRIIAHVFLRSIHNYSDKKKVLECFHNQNKKIEEIEYCS